MKAAAFIALSAMVLISCGRDLLHPGFRKIEGAFYLLRWEDDKTYYVIEQGHLKDQELGGGELGGTVLRIGWNDRFIVAKRYATFRGDRDGWMVIDLATKRIDGPITDGEEAKRFPGLDVMPPSAAWGSLQ